MMHRRKLHHLLVIIRRASIWYFVVAILVSGAVSVFALRANNLKAISLRDQVLRVDKENGDVESALKDLRGYVYGHMNTELSSPNGAYPPVQLKYRYERLVAAQKASAPNNQSLATQAQQFCEAQIPSGRSLNRIDCIQDYILKNGAASSTTIPDSLYKFDFASPRWSPDVAGISLLITMVLMVALSLRLLLVVVIKRKLQ